MVLHQHCHLDTRPTLRISWPSGELFFLLTLFRLGNELIPASLIKDANGRPTYAQLLEHPFLAADKDAEVDMAGWVAEALERRAARGVKPLAMVEA